MVDVFGFAINASIPELFILIVIFALFLIITKKIVKTIFNMVWIAVASAAFPFVMRFLGYNFSTDMNSVLFFVMLGTGLYAVYMIGRIVYAILGIAGKAGKAVTYPVRSAKRSKDERTKKEMEKLVKEKKEKARTEE